MDAFGKPFDDRDGHRVAKSVIAQRIQIVGTGEFAIFGRNRPAIRETLQPLAFDRNEAPNAAVRVARVIAAPIRPRVPCRAGV